MSKNKPTAHVARPVEPPAQVDGLTVTDEPTDQPTTTTEEPDVKLNDLIPADQPNQSDKFADAKTSGVVIGEKAMLRAVHGRLVHPNQVPLEFDTSRVTKVVVDAWVVIQFEAGKLALDNDD